MNDHQPHVIADRKTMNSCLSRQRHELRQPGSGFLKCRRASRPLWRAHIKRG